MTPLAVGIDFLGAGLLQDIQANRRAVTLHWSPESAAWRFFMPAIERLLVDRFGKTYAHDRAIVWHHDPREAYEELLRRFNAAMLETSYGAESG